MPNTIHGPYAKTVWTNGSTPISQTNLNNLESQDGVALASFNPDLITAGFVVSGVTCAKDGTTASQLDVASGRAYLIVSDGTLARCDVASTNFSTTGNPSTTMYLDLNPDGSWSWGTSHSAVANHLTICSVTTDGSSNIATVTDARVTMATLFPAMGPSALGVPGVTLLTTTSATNGSTAGAMLDYSGGTTHSLQYWTPQTGVANGHEFITWDGSQAVAPLTVGPTLATGNTAISNSGAFTQIAGQASVGSLGAPVIVAQASQTHVTATTVQTILSYTPSASGLYRITASFYQGNGGNETILLKAAFTNAHSGADSRFFVLPGGTTSLNGSSTTVSPSVEWSTVPLTVYAANTGAITITYQDPAGTPNDYVNVLIERLI